MGLEPQADKLQKPLVKTVTSNKPFLKIAFKKFWETPKNAFGGRSRRQRVFAAVGGGHVRGPAHAEKEIVETVFYW